MLHREWRLCTQCVRASTESNDRGNSIFVKRLETFVLSAIYKLNIIFIIIFLPIVKEGKGFQRKQDAIVWKIIRRSIIIIILYHHYYCYHLSSLSLFFCFTVFIFCIVLRMIRFNILRLASV